MLPSWLSVGWIGNDAISAIIGEHDPYIHVFARVSIVVVIELLYIYSITSLSRCIDVYWFIMYIHFQELTHLRVVTVLMTFIMLVAILTSIAIVRRIIMATSVLKASITWFYAIMKVWLSLLFSFIDWFLVSIMCIFNLKIIS